MILSLIHICQIGTFAINFSRPAGQVIAQYYEFLRLGREGYTKVQNASYQVAAYLADEIAKLGPYEFILSLIHIFKRAKK